jgi:ribosome-binding factor A
MSGRRLLKAAEAIREVVSMAILTELRDPRVKHVTVVGVEVTPDMREAKVLISIMGNESQQRTTLTGLENARGFLQTRIAERIDTRYTPKLSFVVDDGVKKSVVVQQILDQIARERKESEAPKPTDVTSDPNDSSPIDSDSPLA